MEQRSVGFRTVQVWKLFSRFVKSNVRSPIAFAGRAVLTALLVSFVCVAYIGARNRDQENVLNYLWAIMWVQQLPAFLCIGAVPTFAREHACFRKEVPLIWGGIQQEATGKWGLRDRILIDMFELFSG
ncbi:unnamed protein product [Cladocopium goreaui]|uniref:ABC transporter G family member 22 n=1 Tax=Cladocopium goreaui TaxID=2562237 RepID=A0A9P1G2C0_9DINO|nr:unnamed protein product [Cladocopium goreaui]